MLMAPDGGGGSFAGISAAVAGVVEAANAGFAISENGGQPLLHAIHDLQGAVGEALSQSHRLELQPPLGSTPNAQVYKPFLATVASDPSQGAIPVLKKLMIDLDNAETAINKAMSNYRNTEQGSTSQISNAGSGIPT